MDDLTHPLPFGLRVRNYGQQFPGAFQGTATVMEAAPAVPRPGIGYEYVVLVDAAHRHGMPALREWAHDVTIPATFEPDFAHDIEATGNGLAACSCGMTGTERLAAEHARAYSMCGECWGGGTDAYPCLGLCPACGGSGTKADEDRIREVYDKAEAEIDATIAAEASS
jgi:hypothetical protein